MSYICSRALVEEFLVANCSGIDAFVLLSGSPMHKQSSSPDKTTAHSRLSRFGLTCKHLTENLGAELLTWWQAAFPAKTSAWQGGGRS